MTLDMGLDAQASAKRDTSKVVHEMIDAIVVKGISMEIAKRPSTLSTH